MSGNPMEIKCDEFPLSIRASNTLLYSAGIKTVFELCKANPKELLKIKNCGKKSINEYAEIVAEYPSIASEGWLEYLWKLKKLPEHKKETVSESLKTLFETILYKLNRIEELVQKERRIV